MVKLDEFIKKHSDAVGVTPSGTAGMAQCTPLAPGAEW
eukprot:gene32014-55564_t